MRKTLIYCEQCGADEAFGAEFVVFHCLTFCSPDCRDDYRAADDERREKRAVPEKPARAA
jgi:hypothetical protein